MSFYVSSKGFVGEIKHTDEATVLVRKYKIDVNQKQTVKVCDFYWNVKVKVEILCATSVEETVTGRILPVTLVRCPSKSQAEISTICYVVYVDLENNQFIPLRQCKIKLKHLAASRSTSSCVIDGPCVVVCYKSLVFIYHVEYGTVLKKFSFNCSVYTDILEQCCGDSEMHVECISLLITTKLHDRYIMFLSLKVRINCKEHKSSVKNIIGVLQFFEAKFSILDVKLFFPDEYTDCVKCIYVKDMKYVNIKIFKSELYLGTSEGYMVHVKDGEVIQCTSVFDEGAITFISTGKSVNKDYENIIVGTEETYVELTFQLQIKKEHSGFKHVFVGDFIQNGSTQFLLLKESLAADSRWVLTDLRSKYLTSNEDEMSRDETPPVSSRTAVRALKARLQREQILLHEEEVQLHRMHDFITETFKRQVSIAAGTPADTQHCQMDMVNLVEGTENSRRQVQSLLHGEVNSTVKVNGHWQRTYRDKWCIGVDVVCRRDRQVIPRHDTVKSTKIWLDIIPNENITNSASVVLKSSCLTLKQSESCDGSQCDTKEQTANTCSTEIVSVKRLRLIEDNIEWASAGSSLNHEHHSRNMAGKDGRYMAGNNSRCMAGNNSRYMAGNDCDPVKVVEGTVICLLPLPSFSGTNKVTANIILNWTHPKNETHEQDVLTLGEAVQDRSEEGTDHCDGVHTLSCGITTLMARDVLDEIHELHLTVGTDTGDVVMEDFKELRNNSLAWKHVQTVHHLVVKASPGLLARFETFLTGKAGFVFNQRYDCYVTHLTVLRTIQLQLGPQDSDDCRMLDVYSSCDKDLFLLIHHLYTRLPDHVVILPRESSSADYLQKCLPALQREADFLSHGLRKLLNDHEANNASLDLDNEEDSNIRKVGEKFKRKREKLLQMQNDILNDEKVKHFIEQYKRIQELTDLVVASCGNVN